MKKVMKFICLAVIAILITVLVMKNNASADNAAELIEQTNTIQVGSARKFYY